MRRVVDAQQATLGRLATRVAKYLLDGDEVHVINAEKAVVSGKKQMIRNEFNEKRRVGTYRKGPFFHRSPERIVFLFKQKTAYDLMSSDWSSDVCSSDLVT